MVMTSKRSDKIVVDSKPRSFWTILNLKFANEQKPVWYYSQGESFEGNPSGKLSNVEISLKEFEGRTEPKLLVCLTGQQANYCLTMGLKTIGALTLIEALLLVPKSYLTKQLTIHHEFFTAGNNVAIRLIPCFEDFSFEAPTSSVSLWRLHCFYRVNQLKARIDDVPIADPFRLAFNSDNTF